MAPIQFIYLFLLICDSDLFYSWQCEHHASHGIWPFQTRFGATLYVVVNQIQAFCNASSVLTVMSEFTRLSLTCLSSCCQFSGEVLTGVVKSSPNIQSEIWFCVAIHANHATPGCDSPPYRSSSFCSPKIHKWAIINLISLFPHPHYYCFYVYFPTTACCMWRRMVCYC